MILNWGMVMSERKEKYIEIFNDTQSFISENHILLDSVTQSCDGTKFYASNDYPEIKRKPRRVPFVDVSRRRSFESAMLMHEKDKGQRIGVLNFGSQVNPGGGVRNGASAQEESLCRCSTLYPVLNRRNNWKNFYEPNRDFNDPLGNDGCIYTPDIVICRTDDDKMERLSVREFVKVDVVTCAAPNLKKLSESEYSYMTLYMLHFNRAKHILHIFASNNCDSVVLGAFGCGAFRNPPNVVSEAWKDALDIYKGYFDGVEFAIYCSNRYDQNNYDVFRRRIHAV